MVSTGPWCKDLGATADIDEWNMVIVDWRVEMIMEKLRTRSSGAEAQLKGTL
jgi:hypothetical protein